MAPISGPLEAFAPGLGRADRRQGRARSGADHRLYSELMLDLQRGDQRYDAAVVAAYFYGDLIAGKYHRADRRRSWPAASFRAGRYDAMPPALRQLYTWDGVGYGVPNDADGQVLYYRRDVLNDPTTRRRSRRRAGYDLPVPPRTWQQVLDIARFFDGKNWDTRRRPARSRHGPAPQAGRAGLLPLPVAVGLVRDHARATRSTASTTSTGSTRPT